jgi:hypothetical protein
MGKYVERNGLPPHVIAEDDPSAVALIKEEHQMFRALFDLADDLDGDSLVALSREICVRLAMHMVIEEEILYPALKPVIGISEIDEGIVEHEMARRLMVDIAQMTGREELYKSTVHVLGEETIHHVDEEDRELLRKARESWEQGKVDLVLIGQQMHDRRRELYEELYSMGIDTAQIDVESTGDALDEMPSPAAPVPMAGETR